MDLLDRVTSLKQFELIIFFVAVVLVSLCMAVSQTIVTQDADVDTPAAPRPPRKNGGVPGDPQRAGPL